MDKAVKGQKHSIFNSSHSAISQILEQDRSTQNAPQFNLANLPEHLGYVVKNHYWVSIVRPSPQSVAAECSMSR